MPRRNEWAPLPIRATFGAGFIYAGSRKLFTKTGHANIVHILRELNFPAPEIVSRVIGLAEFAGGLSLVTGTFTRTMAGADVVNLAGNVLLASSRGGFPDPLPGQQPLPGYLSSLLGIGGLVSLLISGPGAISVDTILKARHAAERAANSGHQHPRSAGDHMKPFTVIARVKPGEEQNLRNILADIDRDLVGNPYMHLVDSRLIHFARFVIIQDINHGPRMLFSGEHDGTVSDYIDDLVAITPDLGAIWHTCEGYTRKEEFGSFLRARAVPAKDIYVGFPKLTMQAIRNQVAIHNQLEQFLDFDGVVQYLGTPQLNGFLQLLESVTSEPSKWRRFKSSIEAYRQTLSYHTHEAILETSLRIGSAYGQLGLSRNYPRVSGACGDSQTRQKFLEHLEALELIEDRYVQNQMTLVADLKPGALFRFRLQLGMLVAAYLITYGWPPGEFSGVFTLHSFHWAVFDKGKRLLFISNFDGSSQNYLGDFLDHLSWGLNVFYNNCIGYPVGGMSEVQPFYEWVRNHQHVPQVYYSAYPEDTVLNIRNNQEITRALCQRFDRKAVKQWLRLL